MGGLPGALGSDREPMQGPVPAQQIQEQCEELYHPESHRYSTNYYFEPQPLAHRSRPVSAQFSRPQMIPPPRPASAAIRNGRISQRQDPLHCATQRPDPRHTRAVPQDDERPPMPPWRGNSGRGCGWGSWNRSLTRSCIANARPELYDREGGRIDQLLSERWMHKTRWQRASPRGRDVSYMNGTVRLN